MLFFYYSVVIGRLIHVHLIDLKFSQDDLSVLLNLYDVSIVKIVLMVICY